MNMQLFLYALILTFRHILKQTNKHDLFHLLHAYASATPMRHICKMANIGFNFWATAKSKWKILYNVDNYQLCEHLENCFSFEFD